MLFNLKLSDKGAYPSWIFHTIVIFSQPNDTDDPLPKPTQVGIFNVHLQWPMYYLVKDQIETNTGYK